MIGSKSSTNSNPFVLSIVEGLRHLFGGSCWAQKQARRV